MPYVVPAAGLLIPDPAQLGTPDWFLPVAGRDVQWSEYWNRRELDHDVTVTAPPDSLAPTTTL